MNERYDCSLWSLCLPALAKGQHKFLALYVPLQTKCFGCLYGAAISKATALGTRLALAWFSEAISIQYLVRPSSIVTIGSSVFKEFVCRLSGSESKTLVINC